MNYEFKGEPGPWVLGGCSGRMITTPSGYVGDGFIADVDTLNNARLIAAAPDLLEAAIFLINRAVNDGDYLNSEGEVIAFNKLRDAIHKALNIK